MKTDTPFVYRPWRHGGWYVSNVRYPSGAVGCVSRNYPDRKWRIVCHPDGMDGPTFACRDDAARAEQELAAKMRLSDAAPDLLAVVQRLARYCEQHSVPEIQGIACDAFNALAKAEGRA